MLTDKKLSKIEKALGKDKISSLEALNVEELMGIIVSAESAMKEAIDLLEANPKYQELKESLKALSSSVGELKRYQKTVIEYSLHLLEEKGKL